MDKLLHGYAARLLRELMADAKAGKPEDYEKFCRLQDVEDAIHGTRRCPECRWPLRAGEKPCHG
jgi:hypothetical protein